VKFLQQARLRGISDAVSFLKKTAALKTQLLPHQQRVIERLQEEDQPGLLAIHGLGSGKSLTALGAQDAMQTPATFVVPASLQENIRKEQKKHIDHAQPTNIVSMQGMAAKQQPVKTPFMVVDEAHRARDPGSETYHQLARSQAQKRLLLSGSPFYNHPADIAPLVDLAAGHQVLPADPAAFSKRYIQDRVTEPGFWGRLRGVKPGSTPELDPRRADELRNIFSKWTDYHAGSTEGFPDVTREDVKVPMSPEQLKVYDTIFDKAPPWVSYKVRGNLPPSKMEAKQLNAFLTGARQAANTTAPFQLEPRSPQDPKIQMAFDRLKAHLEKDPAAKAVVYSNFLGAGLDPYKRRLDAAHMPYGEFTGAQAPSQRDEMVRQYNEGKLRTLLLSSAGGEGLDLKNSTLTQLLEPSWNEARGRQVEGRGARYMSHAGLPPEQRKMLVERYIATRPESGLLERMHLRKPGSSVDEYLTQRAAEKERLIEQFRGLLPQEQLGEKAAEAASDPTHKIGPLTIKIDRPKGTVKGSFTYPTDYGYLPGHVGEDGESLDVFLGSAGHGGYHGSFMKLKKDKTPDETKFLVGLSPGEKKKVFDFFTPEWRQSDRTYGSLADVHKAVAGFKA